MAGWLTALKFIPWSDVIRHAPEVADGARKLWTTVSRKTPVEALRSGTARRPQGAEGSVAELDARIAALEAGTEELQRQMLASSELIKALAEQNDLLVQGIETNRVRVVWLSVACAVLGLVAIVALGLALRASA